MKKHRRLLSMTAGLLLLAFTAIASSIDGVWDASHLLESSTQQHLDQIEHALEKKLKTDTHPLSESLRNICIHISMYGPMANISSWFLEKMGDNGTFRKCFFFIMPLVRWMSEPFLCTVETQGPPEKTVQETKRLFNFIASRKARGFSVSLDNVGDASLSEKDAKAYQQYYLSLIQEFAVVKQNDELCMSIKLSALSYDLKDAIGSDETTKGKQKEIKDAIVQLLQAASIIRNRRVFIRIDMEEYEYKALTLKLFREIVEQNRAISVDDNGRLRLGVVIQAYLRDAAWDVRDLASWASLNHFRVPIRLVKGAYLNHERKWAEEKGIKSPVWNYKPSTDANYESICNFMLKNLQSIEPAFATHNIRSQAHVMAVAKLQNIDSSAFEFQMLYGMGDAIKKVLADRGYHLREYVPAGSMARGLKYAGRRFYELANSENALARTMRGDFSVIDAAPEFQGDEDKKDGAGVVSLGALSL